MLEDKLGALEERVNKIEIRNKKVEVDKAWETSSMRKLVIFVLTYIVIVLFMYFSNISRPWLNAVVPAVGFVLSTLTVPLVKMWWVKNHES